MRFEKIQLIGGPYDGAFSRDADPRAPELYILRTGSLATVYLARYRRDWL